MIGFNRWDQRVSFRVLSREDVEAIHWATLKVLQSTGVRVDSPKCQGILREGGCEVDQKRNQVMIPSHIVEEALRRKRSVFNLYARNPKYDLRLDGAHVYVTTDGNGTSTLDLERGERRPSTKKDLADSAVVANALDSVHIFWPTVSCLDKPPQTRHLHELEASFANTEKHVQIETSTLPEEVPFLVEMAAAVAGGEDKLKKRPIFSSMHCTISPLQHERGSIEAALEEASMGIPIAFYGMPQAGATSPVTLAGSLIINNAEVLSGLTITQLACPGAAVMYGTGGAPFDMRTGIWVGGGPERGLFSAAAGELASYYHMPSLVGGIVTSAKIPGPQACYEKLISGIPQFFSACDMIAGVGLLDNCTTLSLEQLLIDDEMLRMVDRLMMGIEVSDETLALDLIEKLGSGKSYLAEKHTLEYFGKEQFMPSLSERRSYGAWVRDGSKTVVEKAKDQVKSILKEHQVTPLNDDVQAELSHILKKASSE